MGLDLPMRFWRKKQIFSVGALLLLTVASVFFVLSRESYFLNKAVRLVSIRISQFERLSFIRKENYRINFSRAGYVISSLPAEAERWEVFARHRYPGGIKASLSDFEVTLEAGGIGGFKLGEKALRTKPYVILYFSPEKKTTPRKGIIFYQKGMWRVLN